MRDDGGQIWKRQAEVIDDLTFRLHERPIVALPATAEPALSVS